MYQKRELAIQIAWQWYGRPYLWGGNDYMEGTDCSGLWVEILKSVGILPHQGDWSADMLWKKFKEEGKEVFSPHRGVLAFWRRNNKMIHVEMCIDEDHTIGASGGGSRTTSLADAIKDNAFVKVRPFNYRGYPDGYVNPFLAD